LLHTVRKLLSGKFRTSEELAKKNACLEKKFVFYPVPSRKWWLSVTNVSIALTL
jgi:hypothetical protein